MGKARSAALSAKAINSGRDQSGLKKGSGSDQGTGAQVTETGKLRCGSGGAATVRLLQGL